MREPRSKGHVIRRCRQRDEEAESIGRANAAATTVINEEGNDAPEGTAADIRPES